MGDAATVEGLDLGAVGRFLAEAMPGFGAPTGARKFEGGQSNPTYRLTGPTGSVVLRRKPYGPLLKSAHAVDREYRVQAALAGTDVPVPGMLAYCDDPDVIGAPFYVMEDMRGRTFEDPRLPHLTVEERGSVADELCRVLAAIHSVDLRATGLADYGRAGNYYARQVDRWTRQYRASETGTVADMDALIGWLAANLPEDETPPALVHGDPRLDNLIFAADAPRCVAVIDWELSTLGHPVADLAHVVMQWRRPAGADRGLAGVDRRALGLPEDAAFVDAYCARRGLAEVPDLGFGIAFAFFRLAAILQGVKRRALDGNASNPDRARRAATAIPGLAASGLAAARDA